jgi:hypothetical protein
MTFPRAAPEATRQRPAPRGPVSWFWSTVPWSFYFFGVVKISGEGACVRGPASRKYPECNWYSRRASMTL